MNKTIVIIVLTSIFSHNIICMKRPATDLKEQSLVKKFKGDENILSSPFGYPAIMNCILMYFLDSTTWIPPRYIQKRIQKICLINRELQQYISSPYPIKMIIGKASCFMSHLTGNFASQFKIPAMQNYVKKSQTLHNDIHSLTKKQMCALIREGADINYCNFVYVADSKKLTFLYPPILFKTQNDYDKSKLLLDLGANPTICFLDLKGNYHDRESAFYGLGTLSPLENARRQGNTQLVTLYSQYLGAYPKIQHSLASLTFIRPRLP